MAGCNNSSNKNFSKCYRQDNAESINIVGVYPSNKIENVLNCYGNGDMWVEFFIPEIVEIPSQKPDIETISEVHSCIEIISQRVIKTPTVAGYTPTNGNFISGEEIPSSECTHLTGRKLVIEGLLKQKIIYTAAVDEQSLHSASFAIPFSAFIIVPADTPLSQKFRITPYIEDIFAYSMSERNVFKNTTIFIKADKMC